MMRVEIPWPPMWLRPSSQASLAQKAARARTYRLHAEYLARRAGIVALYLDRLAVRLTFCPPKPGKPDPDGMREAVQAGIEGVADAACVEPARWDVHAEWGEVRAPGVVVIEVSE